MDWNDFISLRRGSEPAMACAVGVFDGVHLGHKELMARIRRDGDLAPCVLTFYGNPKSRTRKPSFQGDLCSLRQRLALLEAEGVQTCVLIDFSDGFSASSAEDFFSVLVHTGYLGRLVVGEDFRCGRGLATDAYGVEAIIARYGVKTEIVEAVRVDGEPVSSSRIRALVAEGRLDDAVRMLGHPFEIDLADAPLDGQWRVAARLVPPDGKYRAEAVGRPCGPSNGPTEVEIRSGRVRVEGGADCVRLISGIMQRQGDSNAYQG
jgi:FAD synthase